MASLIKWLKDREQNVANVAHDVVNRGQAVAAQVNPLDGGRTYNTVRQQGANFAPRPQDSTLQQLTHNGLTNVIGGGVVKPLIRSSMALNQGIGNAELAIAGRPTQNALQYAQGTGIPKLQKFSDYKGTKQQIAGDLITNSANVALPGSSKVVTGAFEHVLPKAVPGVASRALANAGVGAGGGAVNNVGAGLSNDQIHSTKDLVNAAKTGAQFGAVLGAGGTLAAPLIKAGARQASTAAVKAPEKVQRVVDPVGMQLSDHIAMLERSKQGKSLTAQRQIDKAIAATIQERARINQKGGVGGEGLQLPQPSDDNIRPSVPPAESGAKLGKSSTSNGSIAPGAKARNMRQFEYTDTPMTAGEKKTLAELESNRASTEFASASNELRKLANESGQSELHKKVMNQVASQNMSQQDATNFIKSGLAQMRNSGTNAKIRMGVKDTSASAQPTQAASLPESIDPLAALKQEALKYKSADEPLYHGTNKEFNEFDINRAGTVQSADWGQGIYLTPEKDQAGRYAEKAVNAFGGKKIIKELRIAPDAKIKDVYLSPGSQTNQALGKELLADGYDGARIYNGPHGDEDTYLDEVLIVNPHKLIRKDLNERIPKTLQRGHSTDSGGLPPFGSPDDMAHLPNSASNGNAVTDLYNQAHAGANTPEIGAELKRLLPNAEENVFAQNPMNGGLILKEGPVRNGRQDVIVARHNPETGHLEARQESRPAPGKSPLDRRLNSLDKTAVTQRLEQAGQPMSPEEFASLIHQADQQGLTHGNGSPEPMPARTTQVRERTSPVQDNAYQGRSLPQDNVQSVKDSLSDRTGSPVSPAPTNTLPSSFADNIPHPEDSGHKTYPVGKKVNPIDKLLRTPDNVLRKVGLGDVAEQIKTADRNYKLELPKQIDKISHWYDQVGRSPEASARIFRYLDGEKGAATKLQGNEFQVAQEMKDYLKGWADRLGLPEDKRITNYITHIFDEKLVMKEFDPDLEKLISDKVPGSVYDPFTQQRLGGKGYKEDAFQALDAYVKRGVRKVHMDPALEQLSYRSQDLDKTGLEYVKTYGDRINLRPTDIDTGIDILIKQSPVGYKLGQRPTMKITRAIRQATYRASLGGNIGSAVRNLTQGINTFTELGTKWTGVGYTKAVHAITTGSKELEETGVLNNSMIEDRTMSALKRKMQTVDKGLFAAFEGAEKINRGAAYFGAKSKALAQGKTEAEAVQAGIDTARKTQFTFGAVDTPIWLQSDLAKTLTQFQSYNVKQAEFLAGIVKNKEYAKMIRFVGATTAVYLTAGQALGYKPGDMLPSAQIGGSPPFQAGKNLYAAVGKTITAKDNSNSSRNEQIGKAWEKFGGSLGSATIPGFSQAKKTVGGIRAVNAGQVKKGSSTTLVEKNKANYVKGAVFGPYSLNGVPASNRVTFDGVPTTLTNDQKKSLETTTKNKERELSQQLQNDPEFKKLTPDKQKTQLQTLAKQVTTAEKRDFAAKNGLGQYAQNYSGKEKKPSKATQQILSGTYKPKTTSKASTTATDYYKSPDAEYKAAVERYNQDKKDGKITPVTNIKRSKEINKLKIGSVYDKNVRDLYSLNKTEISNYLATSDGKTDKKKQADQLIAYDKALYDAGLISTPKFKTGIAPSKGGRKGTGRKSSSTAMHFDAPSITSLIHSSAAIKPPTKPPQFATSNPKPTKVALKKYAPTKLAISGGKKPSRKLA